MLKEKKKFHRFWGEVASVTLHIINRSKIKKLMNKTPYEFGQVKNLVEIILRILIHHPYKKLCNMLGALVRGKILHTK